MVAVMVMTPVHLRHEGASLRVVGLVISGHVAGMYALSPLVGWLADRFGRVALAVVGQVVLVAATAVTGTAGESRHAVLGVGLFLLGLGWSCALVAGSTLLTESVAASVRPGVQGAADFLMGLAGAAGGALAGVVVGLAGYGMLSFFAALLVVPVSAAALLTGPSPRSAA
jgi:MFS family permease